MRTADFFRGRGEFFDCAAADADIAGHILRRRDIFDVDEVRVSHRRLCEVGKLDAQPAENLVNHADGRVRRAALDAREHALAHARLLRDNIEAHALGLADAVEIDGDVVDEIIHSTAIEMNTDGTKAAAVTAAVAKATSIRTCSNKILLDRPFAYIIKNNKTEEILFIEKVDDPTLK